MEANRGVSFDFVLGRLQPSLHHIFVDASSEFGIGGCHGPSFFLFSWQELQMFKAPLIAQKGLLAALISIFCFGCELQHKITRLYTDNTVSFRWLAKGRSSNITGNNFLSCWELQKYRLSCKISPDWIPGDKNKTADALSRGHIPEWLRRRGRKQSCDLASVAFSIANPELSWNSIL